jgi:HEXXH motif-containing protein
MDLIERQIEGSVRGDFATELQESIRKLSTVPEDWSRRALRTPVVEQSPALLPGELTSNFNITLSHDNNYQSFVDRTCSVMLTTSEAMLGIVKSALRTLTFVDVKTDGEYFSGSGWDLFGAAHISSNLQVDALGEMLVHESEHARLHLLELMQPILDKSCESRTRFYSPWRADPRPIYGIIHGVHVFSNVVLFLVQFLNRGPTERHHIVTKRLALVHAQVARGLEELQNHGTLTSAGTAVVRQAAKRLADAESSIDVAARVAAADVVRVVERERKSTWKTL